MKPARKPHPIHLPLHPQDGATQTFGCRTVPYTCVRIRLPICALVRPDGLCLAPPLSWKKRYAELIEGESKSA